MASDKPPTRQARDARSRRKSRGTAPAPQRRRGPAARIVAGSAGPEAAALAAARAAPGWRAACRLLGDALAAGATAILLESRGKGVVERRRIGDAWQPDEPADPEAPEAAAALKKLSVPVPAGQDGPEYLVGAWKIARRTCQVLARPAPKGEQVIVLFGPEAAGAGRPGIGGLVRAALARAVPGFLRRRQSDRGATLPQVDLRAMGPDAAARQESVADAEGYLPACDLVAAAIRDRAGTLVFEAGPQGVAVQFDVDGVAHPGPQLERAELVSIVGVLKAVAGLDAKARGPQADRFTAVVEDQQWPCTLAWRKGAAGERIEVVFDRARPKFKTLADTGMPEDVARRLQELLSRDSGLILVAAPRGGGLSTLFDVAIGAADRLLRDFMLLEDATATRPPIQNVKSVRWDSRAGTKPVSALDAALPEQPNVLVTCDLEDPELARRLVAQADKGRLVVAGLRGADAVDGIARLVALGIDPPTVARVLVGAVGTRLVRKLCPRCRHEYIPTAEALSALKLDPEAVFTLFRAPAAGCPVCTGTGYVGRTAVCELAAGPTLQAALAKAADPRALRQAAVQDGMASLRSAALAKASGGITSVEEVQRVFRTA